jgi:hypothetical protein
MEAWMNVEPAPGFVRRAHSICRKSLVLQLGVGRFLKDYQSMRFVRDLADFKATGAS